MAVKKRRGAKRWKCSGKILGNGCRGPYSPEGQGAPALDCEVVRIKRSERPLHPPRHWGAGGLACQLGGQLSVDEFWGAQLPPSRKGTRWLKVFKTWVGYRWIDPGSEWRLHRQWYEPSALADLVGEDFGWVQIDPLYRCWDKLLAPKQELFCFWRQRWQALFEARFDVLW